MSLVGRAGIVGERIRPSSRSPRPRRRGAGAGRRGRSARGGRRPARHHDLAPRAIERNVHEPLALAPPLIAERDRPPARRPKVTGMRPTRRFVLGRRATGDGLAAPRRYVHPQAARREGASTNGRSDDGPDRPAAVSRRTDAASAATSPRRSAHARSRDVLLHGVRERSGQVAGPVIEERVETRSTWRSSRRDLLHPMQARRCRRPRCRTTRTLPGVVSSSPAIWSLDDRRRTSAGGPRCPRREPLEAAIEPVDIEARPLRLAHREVRPRLARSASGVTRCGDHPKRRAGTRPARRRPGGRALGARRREAVEHDEQHLLHRSGGGGVVPEVSQAIQPDGARARCGRDLTLGSAVTARIRQRRAASSPVGERTRRQRGSGSTTSSE